MGQELTFSQLNPFYSPIEDIFFLTDDPSSDTSEEDNQVSIFKKNLLCQFEKLEMLEGVFELFPSGALIIRDTSDIISYIKENSFNTVKIIFLDGSISYFAITSISYVNNAASENEEKFVSVNFTNHLFKFSEETSLIQLIPNKKPKVHRVNDFIKYVTNDCIGLTFENYYTYGKIPEVVIGNTTSNFILYKPLNPTEYKTEYQSENFAQYFYYISSLATSFTSGTIPSLRPRYLFWTGWENKIYFKYFLENPSLDTLAIQKLANNNYNYSVYNADVPSIQVDDLDGVKTTHKKIYVLSTDPQLQYINKNYFYIRKTPRILTERPIWGNTASFYQNFSYQFQDEGEKYRTEIISSTGPLTVVPNGANELVYNKHWGYYDSLSSSNLSNSSTHIGGDFGYANAYRSQSYGFSGNSGYYPYVDNSEMWKNVFDFTPIHPNYSYKSSSSFEIADISQSYLQKVIDARWAGYESSNGISLQLDQIRKIEKQNFISYVLCCLDTTQEETFYALLTGYKPETIFSDSNFPYGDQPGTEYPTRYLYRWAKLNYGATFDTTTPTYFPNEIEYWKLDPNERTNESDPYSFAINLNERRNIPTGDFMSYGPGWYMEQVINDPQSKIKYRPIGANGLEDLIPSYCMPDISTWLDGTSYYPLPCGTFYYNGYLVKMTKVPISKLLLQAGITSSDVFKLYEGKSMYTFDAANIADGPCPT